MAVSKIKGEKAMKFISDYPLYASTSGITYEQAVKVAKAILGVNWLAEIDEMERFDALSPQEQAKELGAING